MKLLIRIEAIAQVVVVVERPATLAPDDELDPVTVYARPDAEEGETPFPPLDDGSWFIIRETTTSAERAKGKIERTFSS